MKLSKIVKTALLLTGILAMVVLWTLPVSAATDEAAVGSVGQTVEDVWQFMDDSVDKPEDVFYPEFAARVEQAQQDINAVYVAMGTMHEPGAAGVALAAIRQDIGTIHKYLGDWRQAGLNQDAAALEAAVPGLEAAVDQYNTHINDYTAAKYGSRTLNDLGIYVGAPTLAFFVFCLVLAWALCAAAPKQDVLQELRRRFRRRVAYGAAGLFGAALIPCSIYFFSPTLPAAWSWLPALAAIGYMLFALSMYLKVSILAKKQSAA